MLRWFKTQHCTPCTPLTALLGPVAVLYLIPASQFAVIKLMNKETRKLGALQLLCFLLWQDLLSLLACACSFFPSCINWNFFISLTVSKEQNLPQKTNFQSGHWHGFSTELYRRPDRAEKQRRITLKLNISLYEQITQQSDRVWGLFLSLSLSFSQLWHFCWRLGEWRRSLFACLQL